MAVTRESGPQQLNYKEAVLQLFEYAEHERRRLLRIAMAAVAIAEESAFDPGERLILSLTGSFEELHKYYPLRERIKNAVGEPMLTTRPTGIAAGIIQEPMRAVREHDGGKLSVHLSNAYLLGAPNGEYRTNAYKQDLVPSFWVDLVDVWGDIGARRDRDYTPEEPVAYTVHRPYEQNGGVLLVGREEILDSHLDGQQKEMIEKVYRHLESSRNS